MKIDVSDIQKIDVKPGQTLVVSVDTDGRTNGIATRMMSNAAKLMRQAIPDTDINIIVVPTGMYTFGVINQLPQSIIGSAPVSPQDAFDHAMKGIG